MIHQAGTEQHAAKSLQLTLTERTDSLEIDPKILTISVTRRAQKRLTNVVVFAAEMSQNEMNEL